MNRFSPIPAGRWFSCLSLLLSIALISATQGATQPIDVSNNGRLILKSTGTAFFWTGDTNWRLYKLTREEVSAYLQDRKNKRFNVIQGPVLLPGTGGQEFTNAYGQTSTNPNNPNEAWFRHIDYIVDTADNLGLYVALVATWGDNWNIFGNTTNANRFGQFLGNRYRNRNNVIWVVAGEFNIAGTGSNINNIWNALGNGIQSGSGGRQLITIHPSFSAGRQSSSEAFHNAPWLDFHMIQSSQSGDSSSGSDNWNLVTTDFRMSPPKPTLDAEANYESLNGWDAFGVRRRAYWSVFAGGFGHTYGANGVWQSLRPGDIPENGAQDTWDQAIHYPGAADMRHLRRLMESRPLLQRIPSQNVIASPTGEVPQHMHATRDRQGRWIMVYVPETNKTFGVKLDSIAGNRTKAWWYDPRTGRSRLVGTFNASGTRQFTTPSWGEDWVLVLDDAARGYRAPGK